MMMKTFALLMWALAATPAAPAKGPEASKPAAPKADKGAKVKKAPAGKPGKQAQAPAEQPPAAPRQPVEPPPPYRWKVPGQLSFVRSAGVQVTDGVPMELEMALSDQPIEALIQHFADDFQAAGLFIPPDEEQTSPYAEPRLTAFDPYRNVAYTVVFQPSPNNTTTLYLATADMSAYKPPGAAALEWAPLYPGAKKVMRTQLEGSQTAVYSVVASEAEVLAFYRESLKPLGYEEPEPGLFQRGGETLRVSSQAEGEQRMVSLIRQGGGAVASPATP
jgi:hypothetical protein